MKTGGLLYCGAPALETRASVKFAVDRPRCDVNMEGHFTYLAIVLLAACNTTKPVPSAHQGGDNRVIQVGAFASGSMDNGDQIIFKGSDNEVVLEYLNTFFHDQSSRDVVIVEGDGNRIRLSHRNVIDNSIGSCDTLFIKGDGNYIDLLQAYCMDNSKGSSEVRNILADSLYTITDVSETVVITLTDSTESKLTHQWLPIGHVFDQYVKRSIAGDHMATYYLGEMHLVGVGAEADPVKAAYYFQVAATKGQRDSQSTLGYIYESSFPGIAQDIDLARYWYEKAAAQGDTFAIERLQEIGR